MKLALCVLFAGLLMTGCSWLKSTRPPAAPGAQAAVTPSISNTNTSTNKLIVTAAPTLAGTVARVNENARFAVVNFPVGTMPAPGQHLDVYRRGLKVGELKVTGPQDNDNTVADIIDGEAARGDELRVK